MSKHMSLAGAKTQRALALAAALFVAHVATTALARPHHYKASAKIVKANSFLGWKFGARFLTKRAKFKVTKQKNQYTLQAKVTIGGEQVNSVVFHTRAGKLVRVVITRWVSGEKPRRASKQWVNKLCKQFGKRVNRRMPSPLGTPPPGGNWNPVFTSKANCGGPVGRVRMNLRERASWSRKSPGGTTVTIELTPLPPKRPTLTK